MRRPAALRPHLSAALIGAMTLGLGSTACENRIGDGRILEVDTTPRSDAGIFTPIPDTGVQPPPVDGGPPPPPEDAGTVENTFPFGAVGTRCINNAEQAYIILSAAQLDCAALSDIITQGPSNDSPVAYAELTDLSSLGARQVQAQVCLTAASCQTRTLELNISQIADGQPLVGRYSLDLNGISSQGDINAEWCNFDATTPGGGALASGVAMTEVAIYQAVKISMMQDGMPQTFNAPVIGGRPALVRVFVQPEASFMARDIVARLRIEAPGQAPVDLEETIRVSVTSGEQQPNSTFNFSVPATALTLNAGYSVGLYEAAGCGGNANPSGVLYPTSGTAQLDPQPTGGPLKIVLVPVRYNADGSGRLPDVSSAQLDLYRDHIYKLYPVPDVNVTVREPLDWPSSIARNGAGWGNILQEILDLRNRDNPSDNTYYYGIFAPASSFGNYCNRGCVTGLGPVPRAGDTYSRGAVGLGFSGQQSPDTFVHEIGHAMGRSHAPCDTDNADPAYPYSGGRLGVWGFDILTNRLMDPNENRDMMGYCDPTWISDYNYEAIFQRIFSVNSSSPLTSWPATDYKVLIDDIDGVRWGRTVTLEAPPRGDAVTVTYLAPSGEVLSQDTAQAYSYDHIDGRYLLLPEPPQGASFVQVPGAGVVAF